MAKKTGVPCGSGHSPKGGAASSTASPAKPSVPNALIDSWHYPPPPVLGGGLKPTEWLEQMAEADDKKKACARAREARAIAEWLGRLGRWLSEEQFEPAPLADAQGDA